MIRDYTKVLGMYGRDRAHVAHAGFNLPLLPAWYDDALCAQVDQEMFFPERGGSVAEAKRVCSACPVAAKCLDYALTNDERHGVWGGSSEYDRRKMRKES